METGEPSITRTAATAQPLATISPPLDAALQPLGTAPRTHRHGWWWKVLLLGLGLWALTFIVTLMTLNSNLIPSLILIGSFLVPLCVVLFVAERLEGNMTVTGVIAVFFLSGLFGVLGASLLETHLALTLWTLLLVGIIEESLKLLILIIVGWRYVPKTAVQGGLLGAIVGAGFSAFESTGYAFTAALSAGGIDLASLLQTEVLRAGLSPVGHVLWTAILGAVLFGASRSGSRYRVTVGLFATLGGVALLHAAWDAMSGVAEYLALVWTGNLASVESLGALPSGAVGAVSALTLTLYIVGLALVTALGVLLLVGILRRTHRHPRALGIPDAALPTVNP